MAYYKRNFRRYDESDGHPTKPKGKVRQFLEIWWDNVWSLIPLNAMYSMMNIMLLPGGLASAGMAQVAGDLARQRHSFGISDFFGTMKRCWKQALSAGLINLLLTVFLLFVGWFYYTSSGILATLGLGCCLMAMMAFSFMKYYLWLQIIIFRLPLKKIYKNAFLFVFLNFKNNLIIGLVSLAYYTIAVAAFILLPYSLTVAILILLSVCIFPGFKQLLVQYCVFPSVKEYLIDPYYAEHPDEDLEKRKNMGI